MGFYLLPSRRTTSLNLSQEHPLHSLHTDLSRFFDDALRSPESGIQHSSQTLQERRSNTVVPSLDVHETDNEIGITAELPGVDESAIEVQLDKNVLTLSGKKDQLIEENVKGWYRMERTFGSFTRSVELPCEVDHDSCTATLKNGVLQISLKKAPQAQIKNIAINKTDA